MIPTKTKINRRSMIISTAAWLLSANRPGCAQSTQTQTREQEGRFDHLDHEKYMRLAIEQASKVPSCPFGSVIVSIKTGQILAKGWVRVESNPIWHGEMTAINNCPSSDSGFEWTEACLYTTGESCPMCQSAIIWTRMPLVVYGSSIPYLQTCDFGQIDIRAQTIVDASRYGKCTIIGGILESECNNLFKQAKAMNDKVN